MLPLTIQSTASLATTITFSGITDIEISYLEKIVPPGYILTKKLTTSTSYLMVNRPTFTEKFICALQWNIPVVNIRFLYNMHVPIRCYFMTPFQSMKFTCDNVNSPIFKNYFICQGAEYVGNMRIDLDFLICDHDAEKDGESERVHFAKQHDIPIIKTCDVFKNNFRLFQRKSRVYVLKNNEQNDNNHRKDLAQATENETAISRVYITKNNEQNENNHNKDSAQAIENETAIFKDKVVYLDTNTVPGKLINLLKRLIIENGGYRVPNHSQNVDYVISETDISYQFILQCVENNKLLIPSFYRHVNTKIIKILEGCVFMVDDRQCDEIHNKLRAMGGKIKDRYDYTVTHFVTECGQSKKSAKCVTKDWVDKCLYLMKKYEVKLNFLRLSSRQVVSYNMKNDTVVVQFTGVPSSLRSKLKEKLAELDIKFIEGDEMKGVTHLVSGGLTTSEKFLCAMVSGIKIIKTNITDRDIDKLEWTEEDADEKDKKIVRAVRYWKNSILRTHRQPFTGWRAKLFCGKHKYESYRRVLEHGGAEIVDMHWTHCFKSKDYKGEDANHPHVRTTDYIFAYLFAKIDKGT